MVSKRIANKFFDRLNIVTLRLSDEEKEQLLRFAEKNGLLEVGTTELFKAYFRGNNGVEEALECPYATWHSHDEIDCAKDFEKKGRIYKVTKAFHDKCWEREQKSKLQDRARGTEHQKREIHNLQERINQTIKQQQNDVILCLQTDQIVSSKQCSYCTPTQQKRCQMVMQEPAYQKELERIRKAL